MTEKMSTREAYGIALAELGDVYPDIVVLDADLSKSTFTRKFAEKYPERFFNMGIAEGNMMGTAAGMAACGKTVFASTFAIFAAGRAFEQIRNSIAYTRLNVKIAATHAGIMIGEDGASHQSIEDVALMRSIPNMTVICPADGIEAKAVIAEVIKYHGPVYIRLGRLPVPFICDKIPDYKLEIGKAVTVLEGSDITIIAAGSMVYESFIACNILKDMGIRAELVNMHTIKPIDQQAVIKSAQKTRKILTVEEHSIVGGLGEAVAAVTSMYYPVKVKMVGMNDTFGRSGKPEDLMKYYKLTAQDIADEAAKLSLE